MVIIKFRFEGGDLGRKCQLKQWIKLCVTSRVTLQRDLEQPGDSCVSFARFSHLLAERRESTIFLNVQDAKKTQTTVHLYCICYRSWSSGLMGRIPPVHHNFSCFMLQHFLPCFSKTYGRLCINSNSDGVC
jgi:hypothetical protein